MGYSPKESITKIWKVVIHPIPKLTGDLVFKKRDELVDSLKKIGLNDTLIVLLFLRGIVVFNRDGERWLIQLIEIVEKVKF
jgi:hypothetical protein